MDEETIRKIQEDTLKLEESWMNDVRDLCQKHIEDKQDWPDVVINIFIHQFACMLGSIIASYYDHLDLDFGVAVSEDVMDDLARLVRRTFHDNGIEI